MNGRPVRALFAWRVAFQLACASAVVTGGALAVEVRVAPLAGDLVSGQLKQLDASGIVVEVSGEKRSWSPDQLRRIDFPSVSETAQRGTVVVELVDGSRLLGKQFLAQKAKGALTLVDGREVSLLTSSIRHVLLQDLGNNDPLWQQWRQLASATVNKDTLVFRRDTDGATRLDALEGVIFGVDPAVLDFEYDGERMQPKRERVIGITFFHSPTAASDAVATCQLVDAEGSTWNLSRISLDNGTFTWTTVGGVTASAPWDAVRSVDYASGNLQYLSDLNSESEAWRPYVESRVPEALLARRYAPRRDESFDGEPMLLADNVYGKGLAMHSYSEVIYRLPADFKHFRALVGMDDRVRKSGARASVQLQILLDDKVVHDRMVLSDADPEELDLDISRGKRLRIIVDYGDDLDISDFLNLCDARLTK